MPPCSRPTHVQFVAILRVIATVVALAALAPRPARAIQTAEVEIGLAGNYDGTVRVTRDGSGRMTFADSEHVTPVTLGELRAFGGDHGVLVGLADDDHPQYLHLGRSAVIAGSITSAGGLFATTVTAGRGALEGTNSAANGHGVSGSAVNGSGGHFSGNVGVEVEGLATGLSAAATAGPAVHATAGGIRVGTVNHAWDLTTARIAHWKLNDDAANPTVADAAGNHDATMLSGAAASNTSGHAAVGRVAGALSFDGTDDYALVQDSPDFDLATPFTIALWVRPDSVSGTRELVSKWYDGVNAAWHLYLSGTQARFTWRVGGVDKVVAATDHALALDRWTHLAVIHTGTSCRLYVNGAPSGAALAEDLPDLNSADLALGRMQHASPTHYFAGRLDDVRILSRALDEHELFAIHANGTGTEAHAGAYALDVDGDAYVSGRLFGLELLVLSDPRLKHGAAAPGWTDAERDERFRAVHRAIRTFQFTRDRFRVQTRPTTRTRVRVVREPVFGDVRLSTGTARVITGWRERRTTVTRVAEERTTTPLAGPAPTVLGFVADALPADCRRDVNGTTFVSLMSIQAILAAQAEANRARIAELVERIRTLESIDPRR